ncbi:MAG: hypothetical protein V1778_05255 [bacterium]
MNTLSHDLGRRGEKLLQKNLQANEKVLAKLKGSWGEGLVITDRRLYILKWGFQAGSTFGGRCNAFEYSQIVSLEINKGVMTGTIEVLTPATQNSQKTYWGIGNNSAIRADNIVTFKNRKMSEVFQEATKLGREMISKAHHRV